jgi:thiamine pyrophosphokinase
MISDLIFKFLDSRSRLHENYSIFKKFKCRRAGMTNLCFYIVSVSLKKVFLLYCVREKRKKVIVFGISGDRIDHTLNNFSILKRYYRKLDIRLISGDFEMFFINKKITFPYRKKEIVSLLGMPKAVKINSIGLKYKLKDLDLEFGIKEGALNESTSSRVSIDFKSGNLLLFKKHFIE